MDEGGDEEGALDVAFKARGRTETTTLLDECVRLENAVQEEEHVVCGGVDTQTIEKDVDDGREVGNPAAILWTSEERTRATVLDEQKGGEEIRHGQRTEVLVEDKEDVTVAAEVVDARGRRHLREAGEYVEKAEGIAR